MITHRPRTPARRGVVIVVVAPTTFTITATLRRDGEDKPAARWCLFSRVAEKIDQVVVVVVALVVDCG